LNHLRDQSDLQGELNDLRYRGSLSHLIDLTDLSHLPLWFRWSVKSGSDPNDLEKNYVGLQF